MKIAKIQLRSPWVVYHEKLKALFGEDEGVEIEFNGNSAGPKFTLRVADSRKADALSRLVCPIVDFGTVQGKVCVVPGNAGERLPDDASAADLVAAAFDGNPVVTQVRQVSKGLFRDLAYCVFRNEVVQYPADNLADINGNETTLMEHVAREVMDMPAGNLVYFCTSAGQDPLAGLSDAPLGEWP